MNAESPKADLGKRSTGSSPKLPLYPLDFFCVAAQAKSMDLIGNFEGWILLLVGLWVLVFCGCEKKGVLPQPPEVWVITVTLTNVPVFEEWIGTLDGFINAQIR